MDNLEQCWEYNTAAPHEATMPLIDLTREEPTTTNPNELNPITHSQVHNSHEVINFQNNWVSSSYSNSNQESNQLQLSRIEPNQLQTMYLNSNSPQLPPSTNTLNVLPNLSRKRKLPDLCPESSIIEMPSTEAYICPDTVNQLNGQLVNQLNGHLVNSRTSRMRLNATMVQPNNTMPINHPLIDTPLIRNVSPYCSNVALNSRRTHSFSTYNVTKNTTANLRSSNVGGTVNQLSLNSNDALMVQRYAIVQAEWASELSVAARDARSRILSENMVVDHGGYHRRLVDMHDGHMDMRFDVDNMSYEQLLELEGRIGDVNVVLSEEIILKCLEIQTYFPSTDRVKNEVQTCCMCLEEYREGEIMVRLDCGHDFHNTCMKKWHDFHNTCPICKPARLDK